MKESACLYFAGDEVIMKFEYNAVLHELPENGGAYVIFPWDLKMEAL